jgi:hypothetical protein
VNVETSIYKSCAFLVKNTSKLSVFLKQMFDIFLQLLNLQAHSHRLLVTFRGLAYGGVKRR